MKEKKSKPKEETIVARLGALLPCNLAMQERQGLWLTRCRGCGLVEWGNDLDLISC